MSSWSRNQVVPRVVSGTNISAPSQPSIPKQDLPLDIVYHTPHSRDILVLLVFFNPAKSFRIIQNLLYIKQKLDVAHIPYCIGELVYGDTQSMFPAAENIVVFRSDSYMFSKENIAQAMIVNHVGAGYSKYILMDCDVVFENPAWVDSISTVLDTYDVVQPFQYVNQLNLAFKSVSVKPSIASIAGGHTGYVWAFRRDWWERAGGLYEYALIGGGDKCLAHTAGLVLSWIAKPYIEDLPAPIVGTRISYLPGTIWHLPHGALEKRKYMERTHILADAMKSLGIDRLRNAVDRSASGILEWKPQYKPIMNALMLNYFKSREDDG
jgi:hypothetical protein